MKQDKSEGFDIWYQKFNLKWDPNRFVSPRNIKIEQIISQNNANLFHVPKSYVCHFIFIQEFKLAIRSNRSQIVDFSAPVTSKFWRMTFENNRTTLVCHCKLCASLIAMCAFKLELHSGNAQFGSQSSICPPVWPRNWTDVLDEQ